MRKIALIVFLILLSSLNAYAQEWMKSLSIAKRLALTENKMILMMWEEATLYPFPVIMYDDDGRKIFVEDMFTVPEIEEILWENFVPLTINESMYDDLYKEIKGKRKLTYIDKFNDDTIKILDVNGNILNAKNVYSTSRVNLTELILKYALDTKFLKQELINYRNKKDFYSTFYLASKYVDYAIYNIRNIREEILDLSNIYLKEAKDLLEDSNLENKEKLEQRIRLIRMKQDLMLNNPKKVLRQLKRINAPTIENANTPLIAFLYLTAYRLLNDEVNAAEWRPKVSLINIKISQLIINNNR
ncbi:hypothetical protein [Winogradskyella immobilis]|uniref:Uncharacterized protein n=1 Tax=Winogradskyella immobilis TaxID=2816852 RepID=A0ABS8EP74_9FLAO|nr:hypothetical protein [Winogradskyella immobilis]MCC1484107.1 hypothetical protein [Winogradskyella immobilis]MCG0016199.1 hypothetical protein [Winogradskyella immobilis]